MLTSKFSRVGIACAFSVLIAVAAPGARSFAAAADGTSSSRILASKLPSGMTLRKASCAQTAEALKAAATEHPKMAVSLLQAAIASRTISGSKFECDCNMLVKFIQMAADGAPTKMRELAEAADSMEPDCADAIDQALLSDNLPGLNADPNAVVGGVGEGGLGAGFGPGFPGSPGFIGSAPGGTIALPPVGVAVTSAVNG